MIPQPIPLARPHGGIDRTCDLNYIVTSLGRAAYGEKRRCAYVRQLIGQHRFPRPLPTLHRQRLTCDVVPSSLWLRAAVDTWLEDFLPPDAAAAQLRDAHRAAAATMDAAAAGLGRLRLVATGRRV